jgi:uncharacterized protein YjiS (DUF1127 family)
MPANKSSYGWINAIMRLLGGWRHWRAARRRAHLHDFMHMSDRMLADIGVRRADVHAALSGLVPAQRIARTHGGAPWTAPVHKLCPQSRQPGEALAATDLSAAA